MLKALSIIRDCTLKSLTKLGEECVVRIRNRGPNESWIDHTGNLRSSIGYSVYEYGKTYMESSFDAVLSGSAGQAEGRRMVQELARQFSDTYALVVVAAMDYADIVEAIDSKDVLESTRIWAMDEVNRKLDRAKAEALTKINSLSL